MSSTCNNIKNIGVEFNGIKASLYSNSDDSWIINFYNLTTYKLLDEHLYIAKENYKYINYSMINNEPFEIYNISYKDYVSFISFENNIHSFIINIGKMNSKRFFENTILTASLKEQEGFCRALFDTAYGERLNKDTWKRLKVVGKIKDYTDNKNTLYDITNYTLYFDNQIVKIYAKENNNGDILIGFKLQHNKYNYFTDNILNYNIEYNDTNNTSNNIIQNSDKPYVTKLIIKYNNIEYTINYNSRKIDFISAYMDIYKQNDSIKIQKLSNLVLDNMQLKSSDIHGLYAIYINKNKLNEISLIDNLGNNVNLENLLNKMKILGMEALRNDYYSNIEFYKILDSEKLDWALWYN